MKAILLVSVVLVVACAGYGSPLSNEMKQLRDLDDNLIRQERGHDNYRTVGCYSFRKTKRLQIFDKENYEKFKAPSNTASAILRCITEAKRFNFNIIGIQKRRNNIICRKANEQKWKPNVLNKLNRKICNEGVGSSKTIAIYQKPATCSANNKTYDDGDNIIFHNVTHPIHSALCTTCQCSAGDITNCLSRYCDLGLGGVPTEICDNWITGQEGVCCPHCACSNNGDTWVKHSSAGQCYECSCPYGSVRCTRTLCVPCPGITTHVPGKCCPKCTPTPIPTTGPTSFTIQLTTTREPPVFPPVPGSDALSRDEQFDDEEFNDMEQ